MDGTRVWDISPVIQSSPVQSSGAWVWDITNIECMFLWWVFFYLLRMGGGGGGLEQLSLSSERHSLTAVSVPFVSFGSTDCCILQCSPLAIARATVCVFLCFSLSVCVCMRTCACLKQVPFSSLEKKDQQVSVLLGVKRVHLINTRLTLMGFVCFFLGFVLHKHYQAVHLFLIWPLNTQKTGSDSLVVSANVR